MKKQLIAFILTILLAFPLTPVLASTYRETAMDYLAETYNVPEERIELYEGGSTTLAYIKASFWMAKYTILPEGATASPQPQDVAPGTPITDRDLPMDPNVDDGTIHGGVYIREDTGELITQEEMDEYFTTDRGLAEAEWEELRRKAGKVDVSLYKKLQTTTTTEKIKVMIMPAFLATDELVERYQLLKADYPIITADYPPLADMFNNSYDLRAAWTLPATGEMNDLPLEEGEGSNGAEEPASSGRTVPAVPAADLGLDAEKAELELEAAVIDPAKQAPDDEFREKYQAFAEGLEGIRVAGSLPAITAITASLDSMDASYEVQDTMITAELTTSQINEVATINEVVTVLEDRVFTTMDDLAVGREMVAAPAMDGASDSDTSRAIPIHLLWILAAGVLLAIVARKYFLRTKAE
ncbi:MAG: hypothetical protein NUK65_07485 [Firmicutes bacterium]|nr:hypothetical protein [Bacillota bacterium]